MFDLLVVHETLKSITKADVPVINQDSIISLLIHDIFGGEILKTRKRKGWHFYNRVDGLRIDLTRTEMNHNKKGIKFEDIPATPDETCRYFDEVDYSSFLMRFIKVFEEAVGLDRYQSGYTA
jgi:hypothetical protein